MGEFKRKNYFTEVKYQLKYTSVIMAAMLVVAVVIAATTYWDISTRLSVEQGRELMDWGKYITRLVLLLTAAFLGGIFLSHKVVGPIHRIEEAVEKLSNGEFDVRLKLRTGDEFLKLADDINRLALKLKDLSEDDPDIIDKLKET